MRLRAILAAMLLLAVNGCLFPRPSPVDLYLEGELAAERGQLDVALTNLSGAIARNPRMGLAYIARGDVYKQQGSYDRAAADFEHAVKLEPFNFKANFQLGLMYQYLKRFADAVIAYQHAVEIRPLDPDSNMNLALCYTQMGQPLRGLPYAQRAVQGNPNSATAQANLGILYAHIDNYDAAAIDALKRSLELNSRQPEVYVNLGQEYIKTGKFDQACNVLETARLLAPSPLVLDRLGVAYYRLHDFAKARDTFAEALRLDAAYVPALNGMGVVAMSLSLQANPPNLELARQALDYWHRSLQLNPNQPAIQNLVNTYTGSK